MSWLNLFLIRFSKIVFLRLPEKEDLHLICLTYLRDIINEIITLNESWLKKKLSKMASSMISIYNEVTFYKLY